MSLKINFIFQVFAIVFSLSLIFLLLKIFALLIIVNIFFFVYQFISRMDCLYEKKLFISFLYIFIYFAKHSMISFQWHWQMFSDFSSCVSYSSYYSFFSLDLSLIEKWYWIWIYLSFPQKYFFRHQFLSLSIYLKLIDSGFVRALQRIPIFNE
jgi:hypothetical protein